MPRWASDVPLRSRLVITGSGQEGTDAVVGALDTHGEFLGAGSYGEVFRHKDLCYGLQRVIKKVELPNGWCSEQLMHEPRVMQTLDHPHILRLLAWYEMGDSIGMVMDFCAGGELVEFVRYGRTKDIMPERWAAAIFRQLFDAMGYCHHRGIVHKDLKTDNILLLTAPAEEDCSLFDWPPHAVVADWGLSESITTGVLFERRGHSVAGTGNTMAPEVWKGNCGVKCDIWSLGCVLFQLFANRMPFEPPHQALEGLHRKAKANIWLDLHNKGPPWKCFDGSAAAKGLCQQMLTVKESSRPDASKCRRHAWVVKESVWCSASASDVREACKSIATWHLKHPWQRAFMLWLAASHANVRNAAAVFAVFDKDHSGILSKPQLVEGLQSAGVGKATAKQAAASLDMDGLGGCTYLEFVAAALPAWPEEFDMLLQSKFRSLLAQKKAGLTMMALDDLWEDLALVFTEPCTSVPCLHKDKDGLVGPKIFAGFFGRSAIGYTGPTQPWQSQRRPRPKRLGIGSPVRSRPRSQQQQAAPAVRKKEPMEVICDTSGVRSLRSLEPEPSDGHSDSDSEGSCCSWSRSVWSSELTPRSEPGFTACSVRGQADVQPQAGGNIGSTPKIAATLEINAMGAPRWKIIQQNPANVRRFANIDSEIVGRRVYGEIVHGWENRGWLELDDDLGYIVMTNQHTGIPVLECCRIEGADEPNIALDAPLVEVADALESPLVEVVDGQPDPKPGVECYGLPSTEAELLEQLMPLPPPRPRQPVLLWPLEKEDLAAADAPCREAHRRMRRSRSGCSSCSMERMRRSRSGLSSCSLERAWRPGVSCIISL